jgi:DNA-binding NarL/FixJ family response regulator
VPQPAKNVLLVSPDRLLRDCLSARVAELPGMLPSGEAEGPAAARTALAAGSFDLVVVHGVAPENGGLAELLALVRAAPGRVVIHGMPVQGETFDACVEAGAASCLPGEASLDELGRALLAAAGGGVYFPPAGSVSLFRRLAELGGERLRRERVAGFTLSPREAEVLALIASGLSNRDLAERLCVSVHTVKNHVHSILHKMAVVSRRQAVEKAYRLGWLGDRRGQERLR